MGNKKRKQKEPETIKQKSSLGGSVPYVCYNGDPTDVDPLDLKEVEESAQFAIDVYNRTHLIKYNFVNVKTATIDNMWVYMFLTARRVDDEKNPVITFLAWVSRLYNYVKRVEIVRHTHIVLPNGFPREAGTEMEYFESSGDRTRCDDKTMDILKQMAALAIAACKDTSAMKCSLVELLYAVGYSSAGSVVDLMFTAKPHSLFWQSNGAITLQARVSFERKSVEFVDLIHVRDWARFR